MTEDLSLYAFGILQEPAPLEFALEELQPEEIRQILELREAVELSLRIDCHIGLLENPILPSQDGFRVLQEWSEGRGTIEKIALRMGSKIEKVKIERREGETLLWLEKGVRCIGCGMILQNQQAWYEHSAFNLEEHKGMRINFVKFPITITILWDIRPLIWKLAKEPRWGWNDLLLLYSSSRMPLPGQVTPEGLRDDQQLFEMLWKKEREQIFALAGGWKN
jgi:uncharacterized C2H2 Zn-finger protein